MQSFKDCRSGWSKEPQWEKDCGSFFAMFLTSDEISLFSRFRFWIGRAGVIVQREWERLFWPFMISTSQLHLKLAWLIVWFDIGKQLDDFQSSATRNFLYCGVETAHIRFHMPWLFLQACIVVEVPISGTLSDGAYRWIYWMNMRSSLLWKTSTWGIPTHKEHKYMDPQWTSCEFLKVRRAYQSHTGAS